MKSESLYNDMLSNPDIARKALTIPLSKTSRIVCDMWIKALTNPVSDGNFSLRSKTRSRIL